MHFGCNMMTTLAWLTSISRVMYICPLSTLPLYMGIAFFLSALSSPSHGTLAGQRLADKAETQVAATAEQARPLSRAGPADKAVPKALLSFGEEMDLEEAAGNDFSLADSTHRKSVPQSCCIMMLSTRCLQFIHNSVMPSRSL